MEFVYVRFKLDSYSRNFELYLFHYELRVCPFFAKLTPIDG